MTPCRRAYTRHQYANALALLMLFGWISGGITVTIGELREPAPFLEDLSEFLGLWLAGLALSAIVAIGLFSIPLWLFMKRPISRRRALLAGLASSTGLILMPWVLDEGISPFLDGSILAVLDLVLLFILLCTLSAGAMQRIIGPGEVPSGTKQ